MKNERLVAPFQSTVTRFKSQEPDRASVNMNKQIGIVNSLHGLASAGQQALGSGYGSQQSFFSRPNEMYHEFSGNSLSRIEEHRNSSGLKL